MVVGASGILAPLGSLLRARGVRTVGVSRGSRLQVGDWDERVALDTTDAAAVADWVAAQPVTAAVLIAYAPAVTPQSWPVLARVARRALVVTTSSAADPASQVSPPWSRHPEVAILQLGWVPGSPPRWHSPAEVSAAVAAALADAGSRSQLGAVRPWDQRPP